MRRGDIGILPLDKAIPFLWHAGLRIQREGQRFLPVWKRSRPRAHSASRHQSRFWPYPSAYPCLTHCDCAVRALASGTVVFGPQRRCQCNAGPTTKSSPVQKDHPPIKGGLIGCRPYWPRCALSHPLPSSGVAGAAAPIRIVPSGKGNCAKQCQRTRRKKCQLAETVPLLRLGGTVS